MENVRCAGLDAVRGRETRAQQILADATGYCRRRRAGSGDPRTTDLSARR